MPDAGTDERLHKQSPTAYASSSGAAGLSPWSASVIALANSSMLGKPFRTERQMSILEIVAARNQHEAQVGVLIDEFNAKLDEFFAYVRTSPEGQRLIVKMQSHLSEEDIYADFGKIYRKYKAFNRKRVGDFFFTMTEELVEKLCDEFEEAIIRPEVQHD